MTTEAKDILTTLGLFVGAIVGFILDKRPIQGLAKQASDTTTKFTKITVVQVSGQIESDSQLIKTLKGKICTQDQIIENISSEN